MDKDKRFWRCENPKCKRVLSGYFDNGEFGTKTVNGQEIKITDIETVELTAICKECGHENYFNGRYELLSEEATEIFLEDEKLGRVLT